MSFPPNVPTDVPKIVPGAGPHRRGRRPPRHLSGTPGGWRFQFRLPRHLLASDSTLSKSQATIRKWLGPLPIREAEARAQQLATLCRSAAALVMDNRECVVETGGENLLGRVVAACQAAIGTALKNPVEALSVAQGLQAALSTLQLVAGETAKGPSGLSSVIDNAPSLTRGALASVLGYAEGGIDPNSIDVAPALASLEIAPAAAAPAVAEIIKPGEGVPTFGQVSREYIETRRAGGARRTELLSLELRRKTFIDVIGDRRVTEYFPRDLQTYVNQMQYWPANTTKRSRADDGSKLALDAWDTKDVINANRDLRQKPLAKKSMSDGYVANVKTMMRFGMNDYIYRDPFAGAQIRWPEVLKKSVPREGIDFEVLNRLFKAGVKSGKLDEALLPPLLYLTSRRLGLVLYLRGIDLRHKYGLAVAQTAGIIEINKVWTRVPVKTEDSMTYFILHEFLTAIGFVEWAMARGDDWIFAAPHEHSDPAKYTSQFLNRRLRAAGAKAASIETIHSLRGDSIDDLREADIKARASRLQSGHALGDLHDRYGKRAISRKEAIAIATRDLPPEIDWSVFEGLDFDKLSAGRRSSGRAAKREHGK
jgi:hypothetical protein